MHLSVESNCYYIALGANFSPQFAENCAQLCRAAKKIATIPSAQTRITQASRIYQSAAFPKTSGHPFANAVIKIESQSDPYQLLDALHAIEAEMGRTRHTRWSERAIDLDLILAGEAVLPDQTTWQKWADLSLEEAAQAWPDQLIIPHPRMHERAFVLQPLLEIAPSLIHPALTTPIKTLYDAIDPALRAEVTGTGMSLA